jgi:hypothetical protein
MTGASTPPADPAPAAGVHELDGSITEPDSPRDDPGGARPHRTARVAPWLVLLVFIAVAVLCKLGVWVSPLTRVSGVPGQVDPFDAMWFLRWTPFAIGHGMSPLTSQYLNYPTGLNLMWNTWMPAIGMLVWPITALGGVVLADNVITTAGLALAAFFAFLALRRYVPNDVAAAIGGLLYGFSPYMAAQDASHAQMVAAAALLPVGLLLLDELLVRQRRDACALGVAIGVAGVLEFFILEEYFVTELIAAALLTAILAISCRHQLRARARYVLTSLAVAAVVVLAVLAYPIAVQLRGPDRVGGVIHDPTVFVTDLANLVIPTSTQLIAPGWATSISQHFSGNVGEWNGYLGAGLLLVVAATVIARWRDLAVRSAIVFGTVMTILSLGPFLHVDGVQEAIHLPWWVMTKIPLLRDVQANRLMVYVYLAAALIVATAVAQLWQRRLRAVWVGLVAAVALVPLIPAPIPAQSVSVPAYFTSSAVNEIPTGSAVLTIPCPCRYAPQGVAWQTAAAMRFKIVGGYFLGPGAPGQGEMQRLASTLAGTATPQPPTAAERAAFLDELGDSHIGAIVMAQVPHPAAAQEVLTSILGMPPRVTGGVAVWLLPVGLERSPAPP